MTHDELLAKIAKLSITPETNVVPSELATALMAVVELHKPDEFENGPDDYKLVCSHCQLGVIGEVYPCETIQAIEKELS